MYDLMVEQLYHHRLVCHHSTFSSVLIWIFRCWRSAFNSCFSQSQQM